MSKQVVITHQEARMLLNAASVVYKTISDFRFAIWENSVWHHPGWRTVSLKLRAWDKQVPEVQESLVQAISALLPDFRCYRRKYLISWVAHYTPDRKSYTERWHYPEFWIWAVDKAKFDKDSEEFCTFTPFITYGPTIPVGEESTWWFRWFRDTKPVAGPFKSSRSRDKAMAQLNASIGFDPKAEQERTRKLFRARYPVG